MRTILFLLIACSVLFVSCKKNYIVQGLVKDVNTGEPMEGFPVRITPNSNVTKPVVLYTNSEGYFGYTPKAKGKDFTVTMAIDLATDDQFTVYGNASQVAFNVDRAKELNFFVGRQKAFLIKFKDTSTYVGKEYKKLVGSIFTEKQSEIFFTTPLVGSGFFPTTNAQVDMGVTGYLGWNYIRGYIETNDTLINVFSDSILLTKPYGIQQELFIYY